MALRHRPLRSSSTQFTIAVILAICLMAWAPESVLAQPTAGGTQSRLEAVVDWVWPGDGQRLAEPADALPKFLRASQLGQPHCRLKAAHGIIDKDQNVVHHIWVRLVRICEPGLTNAAADSRWVARGFTFTEDAGSSIVGQRSQAGIAASESGPPRLYIRSSVSWREFDLDYVSQNVGSTAPMWFSGELLLTQEEQEGQELELRAQDVEYVCRLPLTEMYPGQGEDAGCHTLVQPQPTNSPPSRLPPRTQETAADSFYAQATRTDATQVVWVLNTPENEDIETEINLRLLHMAWHSRMGVHMYVMFFYQGMGKFAADPRIQAMVKLGRLKLILADELPAHEQVLYQMSRFDHNNYHTILMNHALLWRWGRDEVLVMADVDEYTFTAQPGMSIIKAWQECPIYGVKPKTLLKSVPNLAGLAIRRAEALCTGPVEVCGAPGSYRAQVAGARSRATRPNAQLRLWMQFAREHLSVETRAGTSWPGLSAVAHPMAMYSHPGIGAFYRGTTADVKAMVDPAMSAGHMLHYFFPWPNSVVQTPDPSCLRFLHLSNIRRWHKVPTGKARPAGPFAWPLQLLGH